MSLEPIGRMNREYVASIYAQQSLDGWEKVFAADDVAGDVREPLLALCEFYGVSVPSTLLPDNEPPTVRWIWSELRPVLAAHAAETRQPVHDAERVAIEEATAFVRTLPIPPRIAETADSRFVTPHADEEGWAMQLSAAFGTRSTALASTFVDELKRLSTKHGEVDANKINAALAIIAAASPQNAIEACLAAQMVALHWLSMEAGSRALTSPRVENIVAVAKVTRAFGLHTETLANLQGRTKREPQNIHVHKHIHHHGGEAELGSQPEGLTHDGSGKLAGRLPGGEHARLPEVRSEDESGRVLRLPSSERQGQVLPARRRSWFRRAQG